MVNAPKRKGTNAETLFVRLLRSTYWPRAERRALTGSLDRGDTTGHPRLVFEVKAAKTLMIPMWLRETQAEMFNDRADFGILIIKPEGVAKPARFYALMVRPDFTRLIAKAVARKELHPDRIVWLDCNPRYPLPMALAEVSASVTQFGAANYQQSLIPYVALYAEQMLELLFLAGYGTTIEGEQA